ncbi:MAG: TonB-dependent receptor plug domain-containing protein, partial [Desulfobacterales bacterium]|nr:TonB-dependent receptor plug domain-containing protein [Desulfobacterales bacterium]
MKKYAFLSGLIIVAAILAAVPPPHTAFAQTEGEVDVLRMYFTEDDLQVVSSTRRLKPLDQVAEDVSVVTAQEIRAMNAHTVAEVLNRVTGVFMGFSLGVSNPGSPGPIQIQGSKHVHVLVLLDGMPWNYLAGGSAETNAIPVETIERIEIVKGPASSAWGSSLGGVVNIITKSTGDEDKPSGMVRASIGEKETQDYRVELSGLAASTVGYY